MLDKGLIELIEQYKHALTSGESDSTTLTKLVQVLIDYDVKEEEFDQFYSIMGDTINQKEFNNLYCSMKEISGNQPIMPVHSSSEDKAIIHSTSVANILKDADEMIKEMEKSNSLKPLQDLSMKALTRAANVKNHLIKEMARNINGAPTAFEIGGITKLSDSLHKDIELLQRLNSLDCEVEGEEFFDDTSYNDRSII